MSTRAAAPSPTSNTEPLPEDPAARAAETESDNPLINDPFARVFVDAAGEGMWSIYADPKLLAKAVELEPEVRTRIQLMIDFMATRTAFLMALALELPWQMIKLPLTPSSGAPPYSVKSSRFLSDFKAG